MKQQLKHFLQRYPRLYHFIERVYYAVGSSPVGRVLSYGEKGWAKRSVTAAESYWNNRSHPSKKFLVERLANFSPISNILEIGCNSGPNLYLIAQKFPQAEILGVDINPAAVEYGNTRLSQEGISNVKLLVGKAGNLGQFQDKSFDIVFTNALLIHISPDKVKQVIADTIRLARRGLVLMEHHCFEPESCDPNGLGIYNTNIYRGWRTWKRDYVALLKQFVPEERIRVIKIPEDIWPEEPWGSLGAVIEVTL